MFWLRLLLVTSLAVTVEITFNGLRNFKRDRDRSLPAHISLWMLPVYFFGLGLAMVWLLQFCGGLPAIASWAVMAGGLMVFEYTVATALSWFGLKPWVYEYGWHIRGRVRLDYFPFWLVYAAGFDSAWGFLARHVI